ncbi:hypothetical protein L207DRAFT_528363 [Hyaloscypha variabilis F]|uniref:BHLH domain-containing protein n=1 Tax=Hyaloscypha variabilis (strain UAMH 11265 / GT02V1 / F) TaxID=1149755 RepID=A0A2J6RTB3_HYAVF|nr:hypothetical protein L207DRAFT_528363 [Hyaloscypha variabilis F]
MAAPQTSQQKLPTGLAGVLNRPEEHRDSAYYSVGNNSTQSQCGLPPVDSLIHRADSSSVTDNTPSPVSTGHLTQALSSPTSGAMSVASIVSPSSYNPNYGFPQHEVHGSISASATGDSRRASVNSSLGINFNDMRLANSPYASANQSTTSLQSSLAQQRNPGSAHPDRNSGPFRLSNGYQPTYQRLPNSLGASRTAPLITGPAVGAIARAPEPTKGQAWAFPEEEVRQLPSAARPSEELGNRHGTSYYDDSRRNSLADSIASSQFTTESRALPPGQRRLEDGMPPEFTPGHASRASSEFQVSTHHHSLQHRQIGELQNGEGGSPTSSQPYSRTPELRVSHKLAERKRRMEMKDLFDHLRDCQAPDRGAKASKWEILTKAIAEHNRQKQVIEDQKRAINRLETQVRRLEQDLDGSRQEMQNVRMENLQLRSDIHVLQSPEGHVPVARPYAEPAPGHPQGYRVQSEQLPPLRNIPNDGMNGVQYSNDQRNAAPRGSYI